jgi:hypothetical protein
MEEIRNVFKEITTNIQEQGVNYTVTAAQDNPNFGGWLGFSDVLGEYMQVRNVGGVEFNNIHYSRVGFAAAIITPGSPGRISYETILYEHMNYGDPPVTFPDPRYVSNLRVTALVESNAKSAGFTSRNSIRYYAAANRDFIESYYNDDGTVRNIETVSPAPAAMVEVFPMWGNLPEADAPRPFPDPPGIKVTNLNLITFHVITALRDDNFEEIFAEGITPPNLPMTRKLKTGDQMIRWYIPASLIPLRVPEFDGADDAFSGFGGNVHPVRVSYTVGLDRARVRAGMSEEYISNNLVPGTTNRYYFYANRHYSARPTVDNSNLTLAFFQPNINNPYYQLDPQRGLVKTANPTETAQHIVVNRTLAYRSAENVDMDWLGNNGRLTLRFDTPPTPPRPKPPPEPPQDTPPAPQTGDGRSLTLPIIVILLGFFLTAGAEVYRRKIKQKKQ